METTIMENQMEKKMENEMETGIILVLHGFPYDSLYTIPPRFPRNFSYKGVARLY